MQSPLGPLLDRLRELKTDELTLVMFAGDHGSSFRPDSPLGKRFNQTANGLRGFKQELYEGGLRQAALARWPGPFLMEISLSSPCPLWLCGILVQRRLPERLTRGRQAAKGGAKKATEKAIEALTRQAASQSSMGLQVRVRL